MTDPRREAYAGAITEHLWGSPDQIDDATTAVMAIAHTELERAGDGELRRQLQAAIKALGAAETELARHRADIERVRALHSPWKLSDASPNTYCAHCEKSGGLYRYPCPTLAALDEPAPATPATPRHNDGPSTAECRDTDRRWPLQKHGE
jgi:hypothetical protein